MRQVQFVRNDYFNGEDFGDVDEARREAVHWCLHIAGSRTHGTTRRHPRTVFEDEEQPLLAAAPVEPYDSPRWSTVHLGRDHAVVVDYVLYSVPHLIGEGELRVRTDRATVKLYRGAKLVEPPPSPTAMAWRGHQDEIASDDSRHSVLRYRRAPNPLDRPENSVFRYSCFGRRPCRERT